MNWQEAVKKLGGRESRKLENNTYLKRRDPGTITVQLHVTDVVTYQETGDTILNSGNWRTGTTKDRINTYAPAGVRVWTKDRVWYLGGHGEQLNLTYVFKDGCVIHADGSISGAYPVENAKAEKKFIRMVTEYALKFAKAFVEGKVGKPGPGDCFYCYMVGVGTDKPLGELTGNQKSHFLLHMEEGYFVPSLLLRAINNYPVSPYTQSWVMAQWAGKAESVDNLSAHIIQELRSSIRNYMLREAGGVVVSGGQSLMVKQRKGQASAQGLHGES